MNLIKSEGIAQCPPALLFSLINLVEHYPRFLPWCKETKIIHRGPTIIQATAWVKKYGISFHCPFTYTLRSNKEILVSLPAGGPFSAVSGSWRFQGAHDVTRFSFELQLEYRPTWWINFFLVPILKNEINAVIKAFERRALMAR